MPENKENEVQASDPILRELVERVESLPRTDHMTLPAVMVNEIDDETRARMASIKAVNDARNPDDVIDESGKTLAQVRREFEFGVSEEDEEGGKHSFKFEEGEHGIQKVTVIPPVHKVINAEGEVE